MKVITVANQKGGVGKTTTALNFGSELAKKGKKVLLIDFDSQGNLTKGLGAVKGNVDDIENTIATMIKDKLDGIEPTFVPIKINDNIDLIPCNIDMASLKIIMNVAIAREMLLKNIIDKVKSNYDYVIIDTAPSLDVDLVNAFVAADEILITATPDTFSASGTKALLKTFLKIRENLNDNLKISGVIVTLVDGRTNFTKEMLKVMEENWKGVRIFKSKIPISIRVKEAQALGKPLCDYDHLNKVAESYRELAEEYLDSEEK